MTFNKKLVTLSWLRGFFESDGGFTASISNGQLKPVAKFTQKTNSNLIPLIKAFLSEKGISSTLDVSSPISGRAPSLRIQGIHQVKKFIDLVRTSQDSFEFIGKTQRQFLIFDHLLSNQDLTLQEKHELLEYNRSDGKNDDIQDNDSPRIQEIKRSYKNHKGLIENKIQQKPPVGSLLDPAFVSGLLDGDGGYSVTFVFKKANKKWNKNRIEWQESLSFTTDKDSILTAKALLSHVGSEALIYSKGQKNGGIQTVIRKQEEITSLIENHKRFPLLGCYSISRFSLILQYRDLKQSQELKNKEKVIKLFESIYTVCGISSKGRPRALTLDQAIAKIDTYLP